VLTCVLPYAPSAVGISSRPMVLHGGSAAVACLVTLACCAYALKCRTALHIVLLIYTCTVGGQACNKCTEGAAESSMYIFQCLS
jgi:hypothetical protein